MSPEAGPQSSPSERAAHNGNGHVTDAELVERAVATLRDELKRGEKVPTSDLLAKLTRQHDYSIASLAIWHLLDHEELRFEPWPDAIERTDIEAQSLGQP